MAFTEHQHPTMFWALSVLRAGVKHSEGCWGGKQVTDAVRDGAGAGPACIHSGGLRLVTSGREVVPALGPSWAACVNTRIFLSRAPVADTPEAFTRPQIVCCSVAVFYLFAVCCTSFLGFHELSNCMTHV